MSEYWFRAIGKETKTDPSGKIKMAFRGRMPEADLWPKTMDTPVFAQHPCPLPLAANMYTTQSSKLIKTSAAP